MFLAQRVDCAVVEVGIGGRLDATNVVPPPVACGITSLGFDHMEMLGDTLPVRGKGGGGEERREQRGGHGMHSSGPVRRLCGVLAVCGACGMAVGGWADHQKI